jgi:hypothetical protein
MADAGSLRVQADRRCADDRSEASRSALFPPNPWR